MRLWLREDERRPDPPPVPTDSRRAIGVGLALWTIALVIGLIGAQQIGDVTLVSVAACGVALGLLGLLYLALRRH